MRGLLKKKSLINSPPTLSRKSKHSILVMAHQHSPPKLVEDVIDFVKSRLENNAEVDIECHPSNTSKTLLKDLKKRGVNMIFT